MVKVLSQSGISLADVYDVVGSVAGIEQLESTEVSLVHEMGSTIFSERYVTSFRRMSTGDILQSVVFDVLIDNLPITPVRLLGVSVITDDVARVNHVVLSVREGSTQDIPIWTWDVGNSERGRVLDNGVVSTFDVLRPSQGTVMVPNLIGASGQGPFPMVDGLSLRGSSAAFGAGTVEVIAILHVAFVFQAGLSSSGLPLPGW